MSGRGSGKTAMAEMHSCIHEYIEAREAYEAATAPLNSHAPKRSLSYDDPILLRWRAARVSLRKVSEKYS